MLRPTLEEVKALAAKGGGNLVPVYREVTADLETPVSAFLKVRTGKYAFLLESVQGGEQLARYSFIGTNPYRVLTTGPGHDYDGDPLIPLEEEMARFKAIGFAGHAYAGVSNRQGQEIDCPDEATVFRLLGWSYIEPEERA